MKVTALLKSKGIKLTPQRRIVYSVIQELKHCSVDEVILKVNETHPEITSATIYKILDCFAENKLVSRLSNTKGKLYYDINPEFHHHLIHEQDLIDDYTNNELTKLIFNYISQHPIQGFNVKNISIQLYGSII